MSLNLRPPSSEISRRRALRLSAGSLLGLGIWPGCTSVHESLSTSFEFIVVNDTHYMSSECGEWLDHAIGRMRQHSEARFCLLAGDLTEHGKREHLAAVREIFRELHVPTYVQIGNHDYVSPNDRAAYERLFPRRLNYVFRHRGWQFIGLDTSEGQKYQNTAIQPSTFQWLRDNLRLLNKRRPTVLFTHFPLGPGVRYRPLNADDLLDQFREFNLRTVFSGHFHGYTETTVRNVSLTTNRCCALKRGNHDGTKEKGYFHCTVTGGQVQRKFIEVKRA